MKNFDLNIDKILDNWEVPHAIRELIANAIDESILTRTSAPRIFKDTTGWWHIKDEGRGLRYHDLIQSENKQKLANPLVIGKFGIGLKDALATFDRKGVRILIKSRHGDITLSRVSKHSFEEIVTLHATVSPPSEPDLIGTDCCLYGVNDSEIEAAKKMFLMFSEGMLLEKTKYGEIHAGNQNGGTIYINGMKVAEEPGFLFSYNITAISAAIKKSLNRERQNLGRGAYADRVRSMLMGCDSKEVKQALTNELCLHSKGGAHDEMSWSEVQLHAVKILSAERKDGVLVVTATELSERPDLIDEAKSCGAELVVVSENLSEKLPGVADLAGNPVNTLSQFSEQREAAFEFKWVSPSDLSPAETQNWQYCGQILGFVGGRPPNVKEIRISETMRKEDAHSSFDAIGLWESDEGRIIIKRTQLASLEAFAGTLLHEAIHAKYGVSDVSREFESYLTKLAGGLAARFLDAKTVTKATMPPTI
jgi:hypothetical protein